MFGKPNSTARRYTGAPPVRSPSTASKETREADADRAKLQALAKQLSQLDAAGSKIGETCRFIADLQGSKDTQVDLERAPQQQKQLHDQFIADLQGSKDTQVDLEFIANQQGSNDTQVDLERAPQQQKQLHNLLSLLFIADLQGSKDTQVDLERAPQQQKQLHNQLHLQRTT
eukprot:gene20182-26919_t